MAYGEYQFETSPRKLQPEYEPKKKKQVKRNVQKNVELHQNGNPKKQAKRKVKMEVKMIVWILLGFAIFCVISYRNSLINENLKKELSTLQKENEQLQVSIENSLNLSNIEQAAKDKLGMQKLNNSQKIYVSLPKKDYIEAATEEIIFTEELSWLEQLLGYMKKIF